MLVGNVGITVVIVVRIGVDVDVAQATHPRVEAGRERILRCLGRLLRCALCRALCTSKPQASRKPESVMRSLAQGSARTMLAHVTGACGRRRRRRRRSQAAQPYVRAARAPFSLLLPVPGGERSFAVQYLSLMQARCCPLSHRGHCVAGEFSK